MKTNPSNMHFVLRDGKAIIGRWSPASAMDLTIGDRVGLPQDIIRDHPGYGTHAVVSRVEMDNTNGACNVDLDVECPVPASRRPYVALNSSLVPEAHRASVEEIVRGRLELPVLEWEESYETTPVIRFHPFDSRPGVSMVELNKELRSHLHGLLEPAMP